MKYVVSFSGGASSWAAAKRLRETVPAEDMTLLFADTLIEDEDAYRFLVQAAGNVGVPLTVISDGRTPWEVFRAERYIGNSRADPCSKILKRELLDAWRTKHCDPEQTVTVMGFTVEEATRLERSRRAIAPWPIRAPLCEPPALDKDDVLDWLKTEGLTVPRLYRLGFKHNNCGGFCIKAGHEQFALLLRTMPDRFRQHEEEEEATRQYLGRDDIAILRDRRGGAVKPLTLREFRRRAEQQEELDAFGGSDCACFGHDAESRDGGEATMRDPIPSSAAEVARRRLRLGVPPPRPDPLDDPAAAERFLAIAEHILEAVAGLLEANRLLLFRLERLEEEGRRWR